MDRYPAAAASYVVAVDGRVVWERDADVPRQPASLAKLLTALVVLEAAGGWDPDAPVPVSARAAAAEGSRLGLAAGERIAAGDALTALLVRSANDAAVALAEHAAGDVETFVVRMNARARALGLDATFADPAGLDRPGQAVSARDLLRLAQAAMESPEIARRVALPRARVATAGGRAFDVVSSNALLGRVPGTFGVKSGYTSGAGKCLIAAAEREGREVWIVLLDAPDRWWTAAALIEEAFEAPAP